VNKTAPLTIDWRTGTMRFRDPEYGEMLPLAASGRYGLKVEDAERLFNAVGGNSAQFQGKRPYQAFLRGACGKNKKLVIAFMQSNQVGVATISSRLDDLSRFPAEPLREFWEFVWNVVKRFLYHTG
jgi:membrane protease subunit (stomatin/prohibitin family)